MIHQWIVAGNRGGWARPLVSFGPIPAGSMIGKLEPKELELLDLLDLPVSELRIVFRIENFFFSTMVYMVSCFDLNWKLLALLWEPVSHAQKRMMSLPRVPQALVNIRNGYPWLFPIFADLPRTNH